MATQDLTNTTTTALDGSIQDFSVDTKVLDFAAEDQESSWTFPDATTDLGYYTTIPEYRSAIKALTIYTVGKGYTTESERDAIILENIRGRGDDTFQSIISSMHSLKKAVGDSFSEIIRNDETNMLINLKPIGLERVEQIMEDGLIKHYLVTIGNKKKVKVMPESMLHFCNDRTADEEHGTSVRIAVQWVIDSLNEVMRDWRRISHRSTIRVLYVDSSNTTKIATLRTQYKEGIKSGEVLILPGLKGKDIDFEDLSPPPVETFMSWIRLLQNTFYQIIGVPRSIVTSEGLTEAGGKSGYLVFEPFYVAEQTDIEADIWNQLQIRIKFNRPASLAGTIQEDEEKNTGQVGFQPNDVAMSPAGEGR